MRKRFGWFLLVATAILAMLVIFAACGETALPGSEEQNEGLTEISFVDAGGRTLCTINKHDLANTMKTYADLGVQNVYAWNCTVETETGVQEVTVIRDDKLEPETVMRLLEMKIEKIEIYPAAYYTLLAYNGKEYKAVNGQIPAPILPAKERLKTFIGYYATINGEKVQLTDETGAFLTTWNYTNNSLELEAEYKDAAISVEINYDGGEYTQADKEAGRGVMTKTLSPDNLSPIHIGSSLEFLLVAIARRGFTFAGWYSGDLAVTDASLGFYNKTHILTEDFDIREEGEKYSVTFTAHWERKKTAVSFKKAENGETILTNTAWYGDPISFDGIDLREYERYGSLSWKYANGEPYREGDFVPEDGATLYAHFDWVPISVVVD